MGLDIMLAAFVAAFPGAVLWGWLEARSGRRVGEVHLALWTIWLVGLLPAGLIHLAVFNGSKALPWVTIVCFSLALGFYAGHWAYRRLKGWDEDDCNT